MKKLLGLFCSLALVFSGCSSSTPAPAPVPEPVQEESDNSAVSVVEDNEEATSEDAKFEDWLKNYIVKVCEENYSTAHHYFEHPENYGIDISKCKITLGDFVATPEEKGFFENTLKELKEFDAERLTKTNAQILAQLIWENDIQVRSNDEKFDYVGTIWSTMNGVQSNLVTFFSEYQLFSEADIDPLISLINETPYYVKLAGDYSRKQAELGTLELDYEAVVEDCQKVIDNRNDSPVTTELDAEVDALQLDETKTKAYKDKIHEALQESFFPAYQTIIDTLTELKPDIKPFYGLGSTKEGKEYYDILLEYYSGCPLKVEETQKELNDWMSDLTDTFKELMDKNSKAAASGLYIATDFKNIDEIMPFLDEHYTQDFPLLDTMNYELKPLSNEQSSEGVMAYFVVPAIDSKRPYEIRYNNRDYADDPSSFQLYDTFAHEGIPGHMYQTQYNHQNLKNTAQFFLNCMGFQEGYAVYAARVAQGWAGIDEDELEAYQINTEYTNDMALVMDLQINGLGWTLDEFNKEYGEGLEPLYNQLAENPGVFFSYYYGSYKIRQLEEEARESLGDDFDEVAFNNALLKAGSVNFNIVKDNIDAYVKSVSK